MVSSLKQKINLMAIPGIFAVIASTAVSWYSFNEAKVRFENIQSYSIKMLDLAKDIDSNIAKMQYQAISAAVSGAEIKAKDSSVTISEAVAKIRQSIKGRDNEKNTTAMLDNIDARVKALVKLSGTLPDAFSGNKDDMLDAVDGYEAIAGKASKEMRIFVDSVKKDLDTDIENFRIDLDFNFMILVINLTGAVIFIGFVS